MSAPDSARPALTSLIVAMGRNFVIGREGGLPWRVRADLRKFRALTMGRPIVMGRRTYESIGRVLDGRDVIVVSRRRGFVIAGAHMAPSLDRALELARDFAGKRGADEFAVVGGGEIYAAAMPFADILRVTQVAADPVGDTRFPAIDPAVWEETAREELPFTEGDTAAAVHVTYRRRR